MGSVFSPRRNQTPTVFQTCNTCCLWKNLACPLCLSHFCLHTTQPVIIYNPCFGTRVAWTSILRLFCGCFVVNSNGNLEHFVVWDRKHALFGCVRGHLFILPVSWKHRAHWRYDWTPAGLEIFSCSTCWVFLTLDIVRAPSVNERKAECNDFRELSQHAEVRFGAPTVVEVSCTLSVCSGLQNWNVSRKGMFPSV